MRFLTFILLFFSSNLLAQIDQSDQANFLVEFDRFEPSTQDLIKSFEGTVARQFLAPDINGEEQFLGNYKGKTVFVYFFNEECTICTQQINSLNLLQDELASDLKIIAIGDGKKEELKSFVAEQGIQYSVLYNGKMLGEIAYGIEMGYPRLFAIDDSGVIKHVLPKATFDNPEESYIILKNLFSTGQLKIVLKNSYGT